MPHIPALRHDDLFAEDPVLQRLLRHWFGAARFDTLEPRLHAMGRNAAQAVPLGHVADQDGPRLRTHDATGRRIDAVVHDAAYARLRELSYGAGIVADKYLPRSERPYGDDRHLYGFALGQLFGQADAGIFCPICMTDGAARVLERFGEGPVAEEALRRLTTSDVDALWEGAMFLTEKAGGSDVGAIETRAVQDGDGWSLYGEKWFCSNVDAKAILTLARMPGHHDARGTKGLGLFLVLREGPDGEPGGLVIERLKDKLGVRSMATGEVRFEGTRAYLIGGAGSGFRQMAEMLNMSRLYNAVASTAIMRRATADALAYGQARRAFGATLDTLPLWRATMADLIAETFGALVFVFEAVRALDAADGGDAEAAARLRLMTPLAKMSAGRSAVFVASEAMEAVGGNGYIEDWHFARLLRDAQVLPIWEGTTNVLALDVLRVMGNGHEALSARIAAALDAAVGLPQETAARLRDDLDALRAQAQRLAAAERAAQERGGRAWADAAVRLATRAFVAELTTVPGLEDLAHAALRRLTARTHAIEPLAGSYAAELRADEEPLLSMWRQPPGA